MPSCTSLTPAHFFPTSVCTNPKNRAALVLQSAEGQDKFLKLCAEGLIPLASEIASASGASDEAMGTIGKVHDAVKLTRDVTGFLNVFRGVIPGLYVGAKTIGSMGAGIYRGDENERIYFDKPVQGSSREITSIDQLTLGAGDRVTWVHGKDTVTKITATVDRPREASVTYQDGVSVSIPVEHIECSLSSPSVSHNSYAQGRKEKWLKLGALSFNWIGSAAFATAFGISRPVANVRKHFGAQLSPAGNKVADAFPYIMCVNHVACVAGESFEIAYQFQAYDRACRDGEWSKKVDEDFEKALTISTMKLAMKSLEIVKDSLGFLRLTGPAWLRLPLGLGISGLGFIVVCIKTTKTT